MKRLYIAAGIVVLLGALETAALVLDRVDRLGVLHAAAPMAPRFEVDPLWPKPLPNHWLLGQTIGVSVDARHHEPPNCAMLRAGTADSGVRRVGCSHWKLGRAGAGLRLAEFEPWRDGGPQRERLDRRKWARAATRRCPGTARGGPRTTGVGREPDGGRPRLFQ
jgi:hypothetical protein